MLDYIRQTLETILREIYDDSGATSTALEEGAYKKTNVSRIDRLVQSLFNFDLDTVTKEGTFKNFNGKNLKYKVTSDNPTEVAALSPESLEELNETASIIDVIIQLLTGDEKALVRTTYKKWKDRDLTADGYKVTFKGENGEGVSYNPTSEGFFDNNKLTLNNKSIVSRLDTIEKVLQLLSLKVQNKLDFRKITQRNDASPYPNVTSIDDFFNYVEKVFGITFEKNGFYATERKQDIKAESIKNIIGKEGKKTTSFDLYNIIYDAVKRIKNNEWALKYNEVVLGSDYDDYKDKNFTKDTYEDLGVTEPTHTKEYTVTSDMKAILKLLYGADKEPDANDNNNHTTYDHFKVANEKADNFVHSSVDNGVSVLDELYTKLYTVPTINGADGKATTGDYNSRSGYSTLRYDPMSPRGVVPSSDETPSLLGMGRRSKFIAQAGEDAPLSRIDILENEVKAIYRLVGFGSKAHNSYYDGKLTFGISSKTIPSELWGSNVISSNPADNNGKVISINGSEADDIHNRYHEIDLTTSEEKTFHLSAIAVQAYYNTVDIADLLTSKDPNGNRVAAVYEKAEQPDDKANTKYQNVAGNLQETVIKSSYGAAYKSYSIFESIKTLLVYAAKINKDLMDFKKDVLQDRDVRIENDNQIWAVLGDEYSFNDEGTELEDKTKTVSSRLTSIEPVVKENKENIAKLREDLGESDDASGSSTVYGRVKALEAAEQAITKSLENTDTAAGVTFIDKTDKDEVYKKLQGSSVEDDPNDKDKVVLATKASVEILVQAAVTELQAEMKSAIQNNRKLAAMMAYMKCDDINANENAVQFVRSSEFDWGGYDMQEKELAFKVGDGKTGRLVAAATHKKYCGEDMIEIELEDYVDHLKFKAYVPYKEGITASEFYANQTFNYGSNNNATSLDDDSYIVKIY